MTEFKKERAGRYVWNIGYGFKAAVSQLTSGKWEANLIGPQGMKPVVGGECHPTFATKRAAEQALKVAAGNVTVKQTNLMSQKEFDMSITTPWCCNPASETYWSM